MPVFTTKSVLIALGANLPLEDKSPVETLRAATAELARCGFTALRSSLIYRTPCFPAGAGPDYVNAAVAADWAGDSVSALKVLHAIEARFGRRRDTRWGMRTLDLDLLAVEGSVEPDAETQTHWRDLPPGDQIARAPDRLVLPHPRLQDRAFVLVPLAEVAPDWRHPLTGLTVTEMCAALPEADRRQVRPA